MKERNGELLEAEIVYTWRYSEPSKPYENFIKIYSAVARI